MSKEVIRDNSLYADTEQDLLCPREVARKLRISVDTLKDWRIRGTGPKFVRLGYNRVRYQPSDIGDWIKRRTKGGEHA